MTAFSIDQLTLDVADKATLREFVTSWDRHKYPVLFVGAGVSKFCARRRPDISGGSKFSSWNELLDDLKQRLSNGDDAIVKRLATDPLRLAQMFEEQFGRVALLDAVARHVPSADFVPGEEHHLLRAIPWAAIVTTNYDDLLERAFEPTRRVRKVITDEDLTQHRTLEDLLIIKMHGDLAMRETIVLSEEDYRRYPSRRPGISIKVRQLLIEHPLLFLGFSLTDPHFATIDGWIRDTVGRVRLPAIAIMHEESVPAERTMWKMRGIELVRLPAADSLSRLLTALAAERKLPIDRDPGGFNQRVADLEKRAHVLAREEGDPTRARRIAECLRGIVAGARTDLDGGAAAGTAIRFFCWGWHGVLFRDVPSSQPSPPQAQVTAREVYECLSEAERRQLLLLALETGTSTLRLDQDNPIDIADELIQNPIYRLMDDDRASVYLHSARIQRNIGATTAARTSIAAARALAPSTHIKSLLSAEMREVLFQEGDAKEIEAELRRPLDEGSDVLAMCRRGADSLLLRQRDEANQWYTAALERATTGDEKYAALWGKRACTYEPLSFGVEARSLEEELRSQLQAIPEEERPVSRRALALIKDAGRIVLDGKYTESAIEKLMEFLDEARRLGWPHSLEHNVSYSIESAVRQAARLLLDADDVNASGTEQIKEGLALLSRYGLASQTHKLFTQEHLDALTRSEADVMWFREFSAVRPTLSRPAATRLTATFLGIPLLVDASIEALIITLVERTDAWVGGQDHDQTDSLVADWWKTVIEMNEHLPAGAAKRVLETVTRHLSSQRALVRIQPQGLVFGLWIQQGFLIKGGPEAHELARAAADAFPQAFKSGDVRWIRELVGCVCSAASAELFDAADSDMLASTAQAALNAELANAKFDDYRVLQLVSLIEELDDPRTYSRLSGYSAHANAIVQKKLRSTSLGHALHCSVLVIPQMTPAQQQQLLHIVVEQCERILTGKDEWEVIASLARTLTSLAAALLDSRATILAVLKRLAQRDAGALSALGHFPELSGEEAAGTARLVEAALFHAPAERAKTVRRIARWLDTDAARSTANGIVEVLLGVCVSDAPDTRIAAIVGLSTYFKAHPEASALLRERCFRVVKELAGRDPSWRVRAHALNALPRFARGANEHLVISDLIDASSNSLVAIERRVAEAVRRTLAS